MNEGRNVLIFMAFIVGSTILGTRACERMNTRSASTPVVETAKVIGTSQATSGGDQSLVYKNTDPFNASASNVTVEKIIHEGHQYLLLRANYGSKIDVEMIHSESCASFEHKNPD